jgi:hypothetical protein
MQGLDLKGDKAAAIQKNSEENDLGERGYRIENISRNRSLLQTNRSLLKTSFQRHGPPLMSELKAS